LSKKLNFPASEFLKAALIVIATWLLLKKR